VKNAHSLDRVLTHRQGTEVLLTEEADIKQEVNRHFQNAAKIPPLTLPTMSDKWIEEYTPKVNINDNIYTNLLSPPSDKEWNDVLHALPNGKAPGPSGISYEMIKHLGPKASDFSSELATDCLRSGIIPTEWKHAHVYPIPKPHHWDSKLANTRPITLLETARKITTKLLTNRLASVLSSHSVLQGQNYAGLPGGSCQTPIRILESLIADAKKYNKPLFILSQDLSKAFDSVDTRMLTKALQRIKILQTVIELILNLSTDRTNRVITHFGLH
jgi:Reverse transcriptase (RNA-dependent DNA polymerase).